MPSNYNDFLFDATATKLAPLGGSNSKFEKASKRDAKLVDNRRTTPPDYYNSISKTEYSVGGPVEDALILASAQTKQKAVGYLKQMSNVGSVSDDYNDLLQEFTEARITDSQSVVDGLDQITKKFNEFRDGFNSQQDIEADLKSGFSPLFSAMVRALGRIGLKDRRERFHNLFDSASQVQHVEEQTEDLKKELRSWIRVLVTYQ